MGLFSWITKGVRIENRVPKTKASEAVVSLEHEPAYEEEMPKIENVAPPMDSQSLAASILFEKTETQAFGGPGSMPSAMPDYSQYTGQNFSGALGGQTYGNRNILVVTPKTNVEVTQVVENIKNGDACIVCLEGLEIVDAQRRLDFLSGVICAMNGSIKRLNHNTYILTPNGIGVRK